MDFLKKYWSLLVIGLLLIFILLGSYFWGQSISENKQLKKDKKMYEFIVNKQDSIIKTSQEIIEIKSDSINTLVNDAIVINDDTEHSKKTIRQNKQKMHEEINSILFLDSSNLVSKFNREADSYKP